MSKISVKEISLEGFRGIFNKNTLEFGNCRGIIFYGDNGTGKTSFSEGAEWLFYNEIEKLKREGCSIKDARHLRFPASNKASVSVKLTDNSLIAKSIDADGKVTTEQPVEGDILNDLAKDNIILSYTKLRDFVDQSKKDKLVSFLKVSGYGEISTTRDELKRSLGKIEEEVEGAVLESKVEGLKEQIATKAGGILSGDVEKNSVDHSKANEFVKGLIKSLSEKHKLQINLGDEVVDIIRQIEDALIKGGAGKDFLHLEEFQRLLSAVALDQKLQQQTNEMHSKIKELLADKGKIDALSFGDFYQKGKELFEKLNYSKDICPFCDQSIVNAELQKLIDTKLHLSSNLNNDKNKLLEDLEGVAREIRATSQRVYSAQNYYKNYLDKTISFQDINPEIALVSYRRDLENLNNPKDIIAERITNFSQIVQKALKNLEALYAQKNKEIKKPSQKVSELNEAIIKIKDIRTLFSTLTKETAIKKEFESQRHALAQILELYEQFEKKTMESVLRVMSEDINRFYTILHKQDDHEDVRLNFSDKGRGITFKLKFHKQDVDQPIKYLSDSHLNSLGLCFFLASVKHLNQTTNFIILDDVVNSIDANHRRQLIEIIRDHFQDYQFLILTHDETWFEMLRQQLEGLGWKAYEIISWQLESVVIEPTKDRVQKVQDLINTSNGDGVARHLRIYLEQEVKRLCELHHVPIEYKEEYRLEDLWQSLKKYLKNHTYVDPNAQDFRGLFNDIQTNRYLFNLDLHDSNKKVSAGDMRYALDKYKDFLNLFRCKKCTKAVTLDKAGYQCSCGNKFTH